MTTVREDLFGCPVTLSSTGDLESWNAMMLGFLAHAAVTPEHLNKVIASDSHFAMPYVCKGLFSLLLGKRELIEISHQAERDARSAIETRSVTHRETVFFKALCDWNKGQPTKAGFRLNKYLMTSPEDSLAMKLVQAIRFVLGDANGMRTSVEHTLPAISSDHPAYGYSLGCHAFALEETGEFKRAELIGRQAVLHSPDDAWGLHAVAHVYDMTANTSAGIDWLKNRTHAWEHCNNFRYHVWWHLALMHLNRGEIDAVFELYDTSIRNERTDDYRDISNAASLLSRLELDGIDIGNRWEELADLSENRVNDGCLAFADLHYMLSLIGGDRRQSAANLLARIRRDATTERSDMDAIMRHPCLSAAEGLEAFGEGNYASAFQHLAGARDMMQSIGGSHAQRDIFERLTIESAIRSGYLDAAKRFLNSRTERRGGQEDRFTTSRLNEIHDQINNVSEVVLMPAE